MIGISAVASYIPSGFESNLDKLEKFKIDEAFIAEKIGVRRVARKAPHEDTADLCAAAYARLVARGDFDPATVDLIVVVTQNPDGRGLPHTAAKLHGRLGLPRGCASFDISLGCSGFVTALSIATSFMQSNGLKCGLLFTADPYSKIIDPDDKNTVLLFGDGATVSVLRPARQGESLFVPRRFAFDTDGTLAGALCNQDGKLFMNGRQVFTYSATTVPAEITRTIAGAGLRPEDFDLFLFHQGSRYIVETLKKRLGLPAEKVVENMEQQGNTVSSTIPIMLEPLVPNMAVRRVLLCGFGVGLTSATCILERDEER